MLGIGRYVSIVVHHDYCQIPPVTLAGAWVWCAALTLLTISIHLGGIATIARTIGRFWRDDVSQGLPFFDTIPGVLGVMVVVAMVLAALHAVESLLWAIAYVKLGAVPSLAEGMLYSLDSMSTRGASGLNLAPIWRTMGALEAGGGMLLFGISTAFLFTLMLRLWKTSTPRPLL